LTPTPVTDAHRLRQGLPPASPLCAKSNGGAKSPRRHNRRRCNNQSPRQDAAGGRPSPRRQQISEALLLALGPIEPRERAHPESIGECWNRPDLAKMSGQQVEGGLSCPPGRTRRLIAGTRSRIRRRGTSCFTTCPRIWKGRATDLKHIESPARFSPLGRFVCP